MKFCCKCKELKSKEYFYVGKEDRLSSYCKGCYTEYNRGRYTDNPDEEKNRNLSWREANPEYGRMWWKANSGRIKEQRRKNRYGLTPEAYEALPKECAICGSTEDLHIDHDHSTTEVRGMLCHGHNVGLGFLKTIR